MESTNSEIDNQIQIMETKMQLASDVDNTEFRLIWEDCKLMHADFTEWKAKSCNENVTFCSLFLDDLYSILRDLTHSDKAIGICSFQFSSVLGGQSTADGVRCSSRIALIYKGNFLVFTNVL